MTNTNPKSVNISTLILIDKYNTLVKKRKNVPKRIRTNTMPSAQNTLQTMLDEIQLRSRTEGSWILGRLVH